MAYNPQNFRSLDLIKSGFINVIFQHQALIVTHLSFIFGDGILTLHKEEGNAFVVVCDSKEGAIYPYHRVFRFTFIETTNNTKRITNIEEL